MVPLFSLFPVSRGFVVLTVTGRRSGRLRERPMRAVRHGDTLYAVAMLGERSDWLRNVRKEPRVRVKVGGRRYSARAREITDPAAREEAQALYQREVFPADYVDYASYHWGFPTRRKIEEAHRRWAEEGIMVVIELEAEGGR
jgi:deazaflavin-dependent oxidoreductase (nitroreductase family)